MLKVVLFVSGQDKNSALNLKKVDSIRYVYNQIIVQPQKREKIPLELITNFRLGSILRGVGSRDA